MNATRDAQCTCALASPLAVMLLGIVIHYTLLREGGDGADAAAAAVMRDDGITSSRAMPPRLGDHGWAGSAAAEGLAPEWYLVPEWGPVQHAAAAGHGWQEDDVRTQALAVARWLGLLLLAAVRRAWYALTHLEWEAVGDGVYWTLVTMCV